MAFDPSEYTPGELVSARHRSQHFVATHSSSMLSMNTGHPDSLRSLFASIEESEFLLEQIAITNGFNDAAATIEQHALPAAIASSEDEEEGWLRFLHYALIGANLRGAAESLAEPEILRALVRRGKLPLARSIAEQLPRSSQRAKALAVVTAALDSDHPRYPELLRATDNELELQPWPDSRALAESWRETVEAVAGVLSLQLQARWLPWFDRLQEYPTLRSAAEEAVASAWLAAGDPIPWRIRQALQLFGSSEAVSDQLSLLCARHVAANGLGDVLQALAELRAELGVLYWHAALSALAAATASEPETAVAGLQELLAVEQPPWSPALIERGAALWSLLDETQLRALEHSLDDPVSRCALLVSRLEARPDMTDWSSVAAALSAVQPGETQLHWALRAITAAATCDARSMLRPLAELTSWLEQHRYHAPPRDLARFLDLTALVIPTQLRRQLENVLWSGQADEELLRVIVTRARNRRLQEQLLAQLESYTAHVAGTDANGFLLRRELLTRLTARLCVQDADLCWLQRAIPRCAASELDGLKSRVAVSLAKAQQRTLANRVIEGDDQIPGIESHRTRLLTRLRMGSDETQLDELLAPASLYRAVADSTAVSDELDAVTALCLQPLRPDEVAGACLSGIRDGTRRILAHVDLAWHALAHETRTVPKLLQDTSVALLPLRDAMNAMPSLELGAALVPEQIRLGAHEGFRTIITDLKASFTRLARHSPLGWQQRHTAMVGMLATMVQLLVRKETSAPSYRGRVTASLLAWLMELPGDTDDEDRQELRRQWHRLLPFIVAAAERFPSEVWWSLRHPLLAGAGLSPGAGVLAITGDERRERLLAWCDERWQASGFRRLLLSRWYRVGEAEISRCWSWLDNDQLRIVKACLQSPEERHRLAEQLVDGGSESPDLVSALAIMLTSDEPRLSIDLLRVLPVGGSRDRLAEHLLRFSWIDRRYLEDIVPLITDEVAAQRVSAICGKGDQQWQAFIELIATDHADPLDPMWSGLRRQLWSQQQEAGESLLPAIAEQVAPALAVGGKRAGERALRWWLQAFVSPRLGREHPAWQQRRALVREAIRRSQQIGPVGNQDPESAGQESSVTPPTPNTATARPPPVSSLYRTWSQLHRSATDRRMQSGERWFLLPALAASVYLLGFDLQLLGGTEMLVALHPYQHWIGYLAVLACSIEGLRLCSRARVWHTEHQTHSSVRFLRYLVLMLPGIGAASLDLWRDPDPLVPRSDIGRSHPSHPSSSPLSNRMTPHLVARLLRWLDDRSGSMPLLLWHQLAGPALVATWLISGGGTWFAEHRTALLVTTLCLHCILTTIVHLNLRRLVRCTSASSLQRKYLPSLALLCLLPIPLLLLILVFLMPVLGTSRRPSLCSPLTHSTSSLNGLHAWRSIVPAAEREWRSQGILRRLLTPAGFRTSGEQPGSRRVWELHNRLRCSYLLLEVAALRTWLHLALRSTALSGYLDLCDTTLLIACLSIGIVATALVVARRLQRLVGAGNRLKFLDEFPYHRYIASGWLTVAAGLFLGYAIATGNGAAAGMCVFLYGVIGFTVGFLLPMLWELLPSAMPVFHQTADWSLFAPHLLYLIGGVTILGDIEGEGNIIASLPVLVIVSAALLGPVTGLLMLGRLLRPFTLESPQASAHPARAKRSLRGKVVISLLLPFGGLLVPWWLFLQHHRWPRQQLPSSTSVP